MFLPHLLMAELDMLLLKKLMMIRVKLHKYLGLYKLEKIKKVYHFFSKNHLSFLIQAIYTILYYQIAYIQIPFLQRFHVQ